MDEKDTGFTLRDKLVLLVFAVGMGIIVYGILAHGWYMDEISGVFLAMGILMGIVGGLSEKEIAEQFVIGVKRSCVCSSCNWCMPRHSGCCRKRNDH